MGVMNVTEDTQCVEWAEALALADEGFAVFPVHLARKNIGVYGDTTIVCSCGAFGTIGSPSEKDICYGKHPAIQSFSKDATTSRERLNNFGSKWGSRGIGIHLGKSYAWVVDVDGEEGYAELKAITDKYGELPPTRTVISGGGGKHYYFAGWVDKISSGKLSDHVDIKGNVGNAYVVAPPTRHHSGSRYSYENRCNPVDAPQWLVDLVVSKTHVNGNVKPLNGEQATNRMKYEAPVQDLLTAEQLSQLHGEGVMLRGSHPVHGSKNHRNFTIDTSSNRWFCNRCNSSGGLFELASVLTGVCKCDEFVRGRTTNPLTGKKFLLAVGSARKLGIDTEILQKQLKKAV